MSVRIYILTTLPIGLFLIGISANAHSPAQAADIDCGGNPVIIVDGHKECQGVTADSLAKIIADMDAGHASGNPNNPAKKSTPLRPRSFPDVSFANQKKSQAFTQSLLMRLKVLPQNTMGDDDKLNAKLLAFVLNQRLLLSKHDQARIPFTNDSGFFNTLASEISQTRFEKPVDYEAYAERLSDFPRFFAQQIENMRRGIRTEFTASSDIMPSIIAVVESYAQGDAENHPFFKPFLTYPNSFSQAEQDRLRALGRAAVNTKVLPAYQWLGTFFKNEYMPAARVQVGIGTVPGGRSYYKDAVKYYTTLDLTPDEVHKIGLSEVKRIRAEMDTVIEQTGFEGSFHDFITFLRTDPQFYAKSEDELLKNAAYIAKKIDGQMPQFFKTLPRLSYGVRPVPTEIAKSYTTGRYWSGDPNLGLAGNYMVNTYNLKMRPLYNLPALTAHEAVPGHHHQISLAQEMKDVPHFRNKLYPNAFGEGWGLYAEKLGEEMGIYTTPYEQFGRLTYEMWRACRLVVDTGMHWKGWTRGEAETCFLDNSALSEYNIHNEVDRYISWPGQALAYKVGELKFIELRERAEAALGDNFDLREFHNQLLNAGGVPLDILDAKINDWIASKDSP